MEPNLQQLGQDVAQSTQQEYDFPKLLRDALVKKFSTSNPLIQQRQTALTNFLASPEEAIQKYSQPQNVTIGGGQVPPPGQNPVGEQVTVPNVYLSPTQQRALYSREVANKFAPLSTLNDLLMLQSGGIENVIGGVTQGLQAQTKSKQAKFDTAKTLEELRLKSRGLDIAEYKATQGRAIPASLSKAVADYNSISSSLANLKELGNKVANRVGPIEGNLGLMIEKLKGGGDLKLYSDEIQAFASNAAKGLGRETGVLTDKDIRRALSGLGGVGENKKQFREKQKIIDNVLKDIKSNLQAQFRLHKVPFQEEYLTGETDKSNNAEQLILDALGL